MFYCQEFKRIRKEKKITAIEVARYLNKARETISSWERGIYQPCDSDIRLMAQFLNVSVNIISDLQEKHTSKNYMKEQINSDLDIKGVTPDIAQEMKALYDTCAELRAINTGLRSEIYRFRILMQSFPFLIYVKDLNLKYTNANGYFLNLFSESDDMENIIGKICEGKYTRENIRGKTSGEVFEFKEYFPILELEQRVLKTKQSVSNYQTYIPGTRKKKIGLFTIVPILKEDQTVTRIVGIINDITGYCAEGERRKDVEWVVNNLHYILWIGETVDNNEDSFKYTFISDAITEIYGIAKYDAFKDSKSWLKLVHNDDIEIIQNWLKVKSYPKKIKFKINHPDKGVRWMSSEAFKDGENKFYGVVADITEEIEKGIAPIVLSANES